MPFNRNAPLWPNTTDAFFRDRELKAQEQEPGQCVATVLAMLTNSEPMYFVGDINTQDPRSWSSAISDWGLRLAYCPTDVRKLEFYRDELLAIDDLFTISYFAVSKPAEILRDPGRGGWVCPSHVVVLHRDMILDPSEGCEVAASDHRCWRRHTKRIFRVAPADHPHTL